jgi:hypothetical protein
MRNTLRKDRSSHALIGILHNTRTARFAVCLDFCLPEAAGRVAIRYVAAGVIIIAVLAYILALVLGTLPLQAHVDFAAIILMIVGAASVALLFSPKWDATLVEAVTRVRAFQFASLKVELEAIHARQDEQGSTLELLQLLAPVVLTDSERNHLLNLHYKRGAGYRGNHGVRSELRHLRYLTLITSTKPIGSAIDGSTFDWGTRSWPMKTSRRLISAWLRRSFD